LPAAESEREKGDSEFTEARDQADELPQVVTPCNCTIAYAGYLSSREVEGPALWNLGNQAGEIGVAAYGANSGKARGSRQVLPDARLPPDTPVRQRSSDRVRLRPGQPERGSTTRFGRW